MGYISRKNDDVNLSQGLAHGWVGANLGPKAQPLNPAGTLEWRANARPVS